MGITMHNLISFNQLAEWRKFEEKIDQCTEMEGAINDYYECLIECDDAQAACKRICRRILSDRTLECKLLWEDLKFKF